MLSLAALTRLEAGDITISRDDISDWVYRHRGRTFGGFAVEVIQRRGEKW